MNPKLRPAERDQLQRLQGHANALLGRVIGLHLQIGLVDPLLGDEEALSLRPTTGGSPEGSPPFGGRSCAAVSWISWEA
jgi:hypothetical protein